MSVFWSILEKAGTEEPRKGDELPKEGLQQNPPKKQKRTTGNNKKLLSKSA
jgi:hypothetical protein